VAAQLQPVINSWGRDERRLAQVKVAFDDVEQEHTKIGSGIAWMRSAMP